MTEEVWNRGGWFGRLFGNRRQKVVAALSAASGMLFGGLVEKLPLWAQVTLFSICAGGCVYLITYDRRTRSRSFRWRSALFCTGLGAAFWIASTANLIPGRRLPELTGGVTPPQWSELLPAHWSDWLYSWAPPPPVGAATTIYVILSGGEVASPAKPGVSCPLPPQDQLLEFLRLRDYALISAVEKHRPRGIALDTSYTRQVRALDNTFCNAIRAAQPPIISGYRVYNDSEGVYQRCPAAEDQPSCLRVASQGPAMGLLDADGIMRGIPLKWEVKGNYQESLSLMLAEEAAVQSHGKRFESPGLFLRILPPPKGAVVVKDQDAPGATLGRLDDSLVIIGSRSRYDQFRTPFQKLPLSGAVIQAYAVYDLLSGYYVRDCPRILTALLIIGSCLLLSVLASFDWSAARLAGSAAVISLLMFVVSVLAMRLARTWIEPMYGVVAVALCFLALWARGAYDRRVRTIGAAVPDPPF